MIHLHFTPTRQDYRRARWALTLKDYRGWVIYAAVLVLFLVYLITGLIVRRTMALPGMVYALILLGLGLFGLVFDLFVTSSGKLKETMRRDQLLTPFNIDVENQGLRFRTERADTHRAWNAYAELIESTQAFILPYYKDTQSFQLLPRRAFASEAEQEAFRQLAITHIPAREGAPFLRKVFMFLGVVIVAVMFLMLISGLFN